MSPGALLPEVHLDVLIGIEASALDHGPEGEEMELGRAGSDDKTVDVVVPYFVDHLLLGGVGTGEHVGPGHHYSRLVLDALSYLLNIHVVGDVATAVAKENGDSSLAHPAAPFPLSI